MPASDEPVTLRSIALAVFVPPALFSISTGAITPVVPLTATDLGTGPAGAAVVVSLMALGQLLADVPAGSLTARFGERTVMVVSGIICAAALLIAMLSSQLWVFIVAIVTVGMCTAVWMLARLTFVANVVPFHLRARAMSTMGGVQRIGFFAGPFAGAALMHVAGTRSPYVLGAIMVLAGTVALVLATDKNDFGAASFEVEANSYLPLLQKQWRDFATIGLGVLLVSAVRASRQVVIPLWGQHLDLAPATISLIYGASGAVDIIFFYPAGRVMDLKGRAAIAVPSMVLLGLAHVLLPLSTEYLTYGLVAMLMGVGNGMGSGLIMTLGADLAPAGQRAVYFGVWRVLADVGNGGGPFLIAGVTAVATLTAAALTIGAIAGAAAAVMFIFIPRRVAAPPPE